MVIFCFHEASAAYFSSGPGGDHRAGLRIAMARRERRWTAAELAHRVHISLDMLRKIERGEPTVMIGSYFEVATVLGVELWEADADAVERYKHRFRDRLVLLPARVRAAVDGDGDGGRDG